MPSLSTPLTAQVMSIVWVTELSTFLPPKSAIAACFLGHDVNKLLTGLEFPSQRRVGPCRLSDRQGTTTAMRHGKNAKPCVLHREALDPTGDDLSRLDPAGTRTDTTLQIIAAFHHPIKSSGI